jgi:hypothetical protein
MPRRPTARTRHLAKRLNALAGGWSHHRTMYATNTKASPATSSRATQTTTAQRPPPAIDDTAEPKLRRRLCLDLHSTDGPPQICHLAGHAGRTQPTAPNPNTWPNTPRTPLAAGHTRQQYTRRSPLLGSRLLPMQARRPRLRPVGIDPCPARSTGKILPKGYLHTADTNGAEPGHRCRTRPRPAQRTRKTQPNAPSTASARRHQPWQGCPTGMPAPAMATTSNHSSLDPYAARKAADADGKPHACGGARRAGHRCPRVAPPG